MSCIRWLLVCILFLPTVAFGQSMPLDDLKLGGYVIVLRHGATSSDQAGADPMNNPAKDTAGKDTVSKDMASKAAAGERQLSAQGRAQAKAIGEAMRRLKIPVGLVLTSPLQRAVDTATLLGFGEVSLTPDIAESGPALPEEENTRRAEALRRLVAARPPADNNLVIVTHKPNLIDAFGKNWSDVREGEASVFEPDNAGGYKLIVRIRADEWNVLSQATH